MAMMSRFLARYTGLTFARRSFCYRGSYGDEPGYGDDRSGYESDRGDSGRDRGGYGGDRQGYGDDRGGYGDDRGGYGGYRGGFGGNRGGYGGFRGGYGRDRGGYGGDFGGPRGDRGRYEELPRTYRDGSSQGETPARTTRFGPLSNVKFEHCMNYVYLLGRVVNNPITTHETGRVAFTIVTHSEQDGFNRHRIICSQRWGRIAATLRRGDRVLVRGSLYYWQPRDGVGLQAKIKPLFLTNLSAREDRLRQLDQELGNEMANESNENYLSSNAGEESFAEEDEEQEVFRGTEIDHDIDLNEHEQADDFDEGPDTGDYDSKEEGSTGQETAK